jgi:hypothetical protein
MEPVRNPNAPIPGFEGEYTGTVGKEKKVHQNQILISGVKLRDTEYDTGYKWIRRGQKWVRVKKETIC